MTHHCTLFSSVNWSSLYTRRPHPPHKTPVLPVILLKVPKAHTSLGRSSFQFAAASDFNELQKTLKLDSFISISSFKDTIMDTYWQLWLLCVMYCCLYLLDLWAVVCAHNVCTMLCRYYVVMLCCYHAVLSCVTALLCCCLRSLFM